jgi:RHS repeat-associated protein
MSSIRNTPISSLLGTTKVPATKGSGRMHCLRKHQTQLRRSGKCRNDGSPTLQAGRCKGRVFPNDASWRWALRCSVSHLCAPSGPVRQPYPARALPGVLFVQPKTRTRRFSGTVSGYRYYSPGFQRWVNRDPIDEAGGPHLYAFVGDNPLQKVDSWGLWPGFPSVKACPRRKSCVEEAFSAQAEHFPGMGDPYGGAYRHCVAACCLTRRYTVVIASLAVMLWDECNESSGAPDSPGDMLGEKVGLYVGMHDKKPCDQACLRFYPNPPRPFTPGGLPGFNINYPHDVR